MPKLVSKSYVFESSIKKFPDFTCDTAEFSRDDHFFDMWYPKSYIEKDGEVYVKEGYMLKINIPKGTKILDCNATYEDNYARMGSEVVLPPSSWKVDSIDNDLKVIELSPLKV